MLIPGQPKYSFVNTHRTLWKVKCPKCGYFLHYTSRTVSVCCEMCGSQFRVTAREEPVPAGRH